LIGLLGASCERPPQPPTSISRFPADLANRELKPAGIFEDGWISPIASLNLYQPEGKPLLIVRGMVPKIDREDYRTSVEVRVDRHVVARQSLGLGEFTLEAQVPAMPGKHRIELTFDNPQILPAGDGRAIGSRLSFAGFEPAARRAVGTDIVAPGTGIRLGSCWQVLETFHNETFRWVTNDARILIAAPRAGTQRLEIALASGPGLEGKSFVLQARDPSGRQVAAVEVRGRQTAELLLPVEAGENDFRLHVDGGGHATPGKDPRILNFRVFRIEAD
jgi:hypothetical protein